jgi:hypothetical protein
MIDGMMQRATEELRLGKSATMIMMYGLRGPTTLAYILQNRPCKPLE